MASLPFPAAAFLAGLMSFLSPCVLPLVPGYVSMISGVGVQQLREEHAARPVVMLQALLFVLGFSAVFVTFGAIASSVGQLAARHTVLLSQLAGVIIVAFGLHSPGWYRFAGCARTNRSTRCSPTGDPRARFSSASPSGLAGRRAWDRFSRRSWRCIRSVFAPPFLGAALGIGRFLSTYQRFRHHVAHMELIGGTLMIAVGALVFTRHLTVVNAWLSDIPLFRGMAEHLL